MRWTTLRGLISRSAQAVLVFAAMNLKKSAAWLWKTDRTSPKFSFLFVTRDKNVKNSRGCRISREFVFNLSAFRGTRCLS